MSDEKREPVQVVHFDEAGCKEAQYQWAKRIHETLHAERPTSETELRLLGRVPFEEGARWAWMKAQSFTPSTELEAEIERLKPGESDGDLLARLGTSADKWALEFLKRKPDAQDFLTMVGWFANALNAGWDEGERRRNQHLAVLADENERLKRALEETQIGHSKTQSGHGDE